MSHHHNPNQPFSIPQIRYIPEPLKPWVLILCIIVFNCTGGVYLAAVSEMVGSTQLLQEDIMLAGYASLVGMALFFAIKAASNRCWFKDAEKSYPVSI